MKKRLVALVMAGVMVSSLAACGGTPKAADSSGEQQEMGNSETADPDAGKKKDGDITIRVASRYGADVPDEEFFRKKVQEFSDMDNGITVEMDTIPTESDYLDKLRTSFANGDTPNVFIEYGGSRVIDYLEAEALVDMQPYYDEDQDWYTTFYPSMFEELKYEEEGYEGIWGVPFKSYMVVLYYNKEIFEQNGLTAPKSWDEMLEVSAKLKEAGVKPFQVGEKDIFRLGHFHNNIVLKSLGADAASKLADRSLAYDSPEMLETYNKIGQLVEEGYLGDDILNTDYNTEKSTYAAGECAMRWDGSWYVSEIFGTDIYDKTGVAAFPYIDEQYKDVAQGGSSDMWFVSKLNKSQEEIDASIEFVKYITSSEYFAQNNEVSSILYPAEFTATDKTPENPLLDEVKNIAGQMKEMRTDLQNYDPQSSMLDTVRNALQGVAMGNTPEQCGQDIVNSIE